MNEIHPDCQAVLRQVRAFLDNELDEASAETIALHLDACMQCAGQADVEVAIRALVKRSCSDRAPVDLRAKLQASLEAWTQQSSPSPNA